MGRKLTTDEFIRRASEANGGKYRYEAVEYISSKTKVKVICPEHGYFYTTPSDHLLGHGCKACAVALTSNSRKSSRDEFTEKAVEVHGDKYDYSKVLYITSKTKVEIICKEHGSFYITPNHHLNGKGCKLCGVTKRSNIMKSVAAATFLEKALSVHGTKYDYSKVEYVSCSTRVCIVCPEHGEFFQPPSRHLSGVGCQSCGISRTGAIKSASAAAEFADKASAIHGNRYSYLLAEYETASTPVKIVCEEHGEFHQTPANHLSGTGCPSCAKNGFQPYKPASFYIYEIQSCTNSFTGFGISGDYKTRESCHKKTLKDREMSLARKHVLYCEQGHFARDLENRVLEAFPRVPVATDTPGFIRENTSASFDDVVLYVNNIYIGEDNANIGRGE